MENLTNYSLFGKIACKSVLKVKTAFTEFITDLIDACYWTRIRVKRRYFVAGLCINLLWEFKETLIR